MSTGDKKRQKKTKPKSFKGVGSVGKGRPQGVPNKTTAEMRAIIREHTGDLVAELLRLAKESRAESIRVAAIKELFDRGYGRPTQITEVSLADTVQPILEAVFPGRRGGIVAKKT